MEIVSQLDDLVNALMLRKAPRMQAFIQELAHEHHFDLTSEDWATNKELLLDLGYLGTLAIERLGSHHLSISQFVVVNRKRVYCPKVVLYTGSPKWVPTGIMSSGIPFTSYAVTRSTNRLLWCLEPRGLARLASFCEGWAKELRDAGWLEDAMRRE